MYYVGFSTCTILASLILFQGFYDTGGSQTASLFVGFSVIFLGVHLLEHSRGPELPLPGGHSALDAGLMQPRLSISGRASMDGWPPGSPTAVALGARAHARRGSGARGSRDGRVLFNAFEDELPPANASLARLPEEEDEDEESDDENATERTALRLNGMAPRGPPARSPRTSPHHNGGFGS
jgi:hypothetical protein